MTCHVLHTATEFWADESAMRQVLHRLVKDGSDFQGKLMRWLSGCLAYHSDGHIAIVRERRQIVGWARTEFWTDGDGYRWRTLEAFVEDRHRSRGIASFAAAGLRSAVLSRRDVVVAVFHPSMEKVARRAGIEVVLHRRHADGHWVLA